MKYRKEIDGLRAITIIPVILFHAGFEIFEGGYVGVDVFFVISGYLITSLILKEKSEGEFNVLKFYERRARRILPALFFVILTSIPFAYFWMLPDSFENFGQSIVATSVFLNNYLLVLTSGYWDISSEFKPLLHTWSLGIEEQFYIIFPLIIILTWKLGKKWLIGTLIILCLISFALAEYGSSNISKCLSVAACTQHTINPKNSFFLIYMRGWELLIGVLIAFYLNKKTKTEIKSQINELFSIGGCCLIIFSIFTFDKNTIHPGYMTLMPTIGAALIILFTNKNTTIYKFLSNGVLVSIGLISYSLYLWHQPIFSFYRIFSKDMPTDFEMAFLLLPILVLAIFSWKFIEKPFRSNVVSAKTFSYSFLIATIIFIIFGYSIHKSQGYPNRLKYDFNYAHEDHILYNEKNKKLKSNSFRKKDSLKILILGNSFARDFANILIESFNLENIELVLREEFYDCFSYDEKSRKESKIFKSLLQADIKVFKSLYNQADIIVLASGKFTPDCYKEDLLKINEDKKELFYVGTKNFGYNLNWIMRLKSESRIKKYNKILDDVIEQEKLMKQVIPKSNYISLMDSLTYKNRVQITSENGILFSPDGTHLTKEGAIFIGKNGVENSRLGEILKSYSIKD